MLIKNLKKIYSWFRGRENLIKLHIIMEENGELHYQVGSGREHGPFNKLSELLKDLVSRLDNKKQE